MPIYQFGIRNGDHFEIAEGIHFPNDRAARAHATWIVYDQKVDEATWREYTMEVKRDGQLIWKIPFEVSWPRSDTQ